MVAIGTMVIWGLTRVLLLGDEVRAASADLHLLAEGDAFTGMALVLLVLRSFTQGAAALTGRRGDQQRRAGVPQAQVEERGDDAAAARACCR